MSLFYNGSAGNERVLDLVVDPANPVDLSAALSEMSVPDIPLLDTNDGVEVSWGDLGEASVLVFSRGGNSRQRIGILPPGTTQVRLPRLPTDNGVPTIAGVGAFVLASGAPYTDFWKVMDCRESHWHAYRGFVSAAF